MVLLVLAVLGQPRTGPLLSSDYFDRYLVSSAEPDRRDRHRAGPRCGVLRPPRGRVRAWVDRLWERIRPWWWLALALAIAVTADLAAPRGQHRHTAPRQAPLASGHFPIQGDDYFSAVNGRTPLVNYISQYANLLPLALEPVLKPSALDHLVLDQHVRAFRSRDGRHLWGIPAGHAECVDRAGPLCALGRPEPVPLERLRPATGSSTGSTTASSRGATSARSCSPCSAPPDASAADPALAAVRLRRAGRAQQLRIRDRGAARPDRRPVTGAGPLHSARATLDALVVQGVAGLLGALALVCAIDLLRAGELPDPTLLTYFNRALPPRLVRAPRRCRRSGCTGPSSPPTPERC